MPDLPGQKRGKILTSLDLQKLDVTGITLSGAVSGSGLLGTDIQTALPTGSITLSGDVTGSVDGSGNITTTIVGSAPAVDPIILEGSIIGTQGLNTTPEKIQTSFAEGSITLFGDVMGTINNSGLITTTFSSSPSGSDDYFPIELLGAVEGIQSGPQHPGSYIETSLASGSVTLTGAVTGQINSTGIISTSISSTYSTVRLQGEIVGSGSIWNPINTTIQNKSITLGGVLTGTGSLGGTINTSFNSNTVQLQGAINGSINSTGIIGTAFSAGILQLAGAVTGTVNSLGIIQTSLNTVDSLSVLNIYSPDYWNSSISETNKRHVTNHSKTDFNNDTYFNDTAYFYSSVYFNGATNVNVYFNTKAFFSDDLEIDSSSYLKVSNISTPSGVDSVDFQKPIQVFGTGLYTYYTSSVKRISYLQCNSFTADGATRYASNARYYPLNGIPDAEGYFSIKCSAAIKATDFWQVSSSLIKNIHASGKAIVKEARELFTNIKFSKYTYKDTIQHGTGVAYGVIAEDLAEVYPDAVSYEKEDIIPNILKIGIVKGDEIHLEEGLDFPLKSGSKINVLDNTNKEHFVELLDQKDNVLYFNTGILKSISNNEPVFVKGVLGTIPTVSSKKISELGLVVLQDLIGVVDNLKERITYLEARLAEK